MERVLRRRSRKGGSSAFLDEVAVTDNSSSDDLHHAQNSGDERSKNRPKLTCPIFSGVDLMSWLSRFNQYANLTNIEKSSKVRYAAYFLEGEVNQWWQWLGRVYKKKGKEIRWKDFEHELMNRFGPSEILILMRYYHI